MKRKNQFSFCKSLSELEGFYCLRRKRLVTIWQIEELCILEKDYHERFSQIEGMNKRRNERRKYLRQMRNK